MVNYNYNHAEVTRLLDEMEACVNRVKVLVAKFCEEDWGVFDGRLDL